MVQASAVPPLISDQHDGNPELTPSKSSVKGIPIASHGVVLIELTEALVSLTLQTARTSIRYSVLGVKPVRLNGEVSGFGLTVSIVAPSP